MNRLLPNGWRLSCGALKKAHSLIYARCQLQALVRQHPKGESPVDTIRRREGPTCQRAQLGGEKDWLRS